MDCVTVNVRLNENAFNSNKNQIIRNAGVKGKN